MKDIPFYIALKIATIIEEHTEKDIKAAISLLEEYGGHSLILDYLASRDSNSPSTEDQQQKKATRPIEEQRSKAVINLERSDPEKYKVLSEFDSMIRKGQILSTLDDLKRFGERISKDFTPRKSRKETIGALLALIADRSLDDIEKLIEFAASFGATGDVDEYQRLAKFLIKGKSAPNNEA